MSKAIPQIRKYMSTVPHTIDSNSSIEKAMNLMKEHSIRHLPVTNCGDLVGILSDRDVKSVQAFAGADPKLVKVGDVCDDTPVKIEASDSIDQVAEVLAEKKIGSAIVVDNDRLVGIFTVVDALHALVEISRAKFHS